MDDSQIRQIQRPHSSLLTLYLVQSLLTLIAFPFVFLPHFFKYHTLRYKIDDEGISAAWGILFKREIFLTYRRIQDIHVSRNIVERWLGIGKVEIQTASGSSGAELTLEGMEHYGEVRDFLYRRMRGTGPIAAAPAGRGRPGTEKTAGTEAELVALLRGIKHDVDGVRRALESGRGEA